MTYKVGSMADAGIAIIVGLLIGLVAAELVKPSPQPAAAAFSHANCQYPDRWTNPPNGCDNSDPAVPECIKSFNTEQGEKDCIAAYVAQQQPSVPVEQPKPAQTPEVAQCGGK